MADSVTETTTVSWGSRLGDSLKGVLVGLGLFIVAFPLLFWNEGNFVKTRKALDEGAGAVVEVESAQVDAANEGKLIHTSGTVTTPDILADAVFGIRTNAISLARSVEMFQWKESKHVKEEKQTGGSVKRTTTYTYSRGWSSVLEDSSKFKEQVGHENPTSFPFEKEKWLAKSARVGAFALTEAQIGRVGAAQAYQFPEGFQLPEALRARNARIKGTDTVYLGVGTEPDAPERVGDVRVTWKVIWPHTVSLVAQQKGNSFTAYKTSNGKTISLMADAAKNAAEMFEDAQAANVLMTWGLRLGGFLLMLAGLRMVFKPVSVLGDVLPILGTLLETGLGVVAFLIALPCTLTTIAVAWLFYRPLVGVPLLAVSLFCVWKLIQRRKAKKLEKTGNTETK